MKKYKIGIVGATGMVGRCMIEVLEQSALPISSVVYLASPKSSGKLLPWQGKQIRVKALTKYNIKNLNLDFVLMSAGSDISKEFAPIFADMGTTVIDNSSYWRMNNNVPLVVPEVNLHAIKDSHKIIANPNCSTIQAVAALAPLHTKYKIKRIVYSTYQAVSGAGYGGYTDLQNGLQGLPNKHFVHPISGNLIPHIDSFLDNGYTKEEAKLINETKKILDDYLINITATAVRVPVLNSHSESVNVEFASEFDLADIVNILKHAGGVRVVDDPQNALYPMPIDATGKDDVLVGRIRRDNSIPYGLNLWIVADNLRKGAATNAIQIMQSLISMRSNT